MKRRILGCAVVWLALGCAQVRAQGGTQDRGNWRAASTTANAITGDIALANEKLAISFTVYPMAEIRMLTAAELGAVFGDEGGAGGTGNLYKVSIPAAKRFLHKNTLCGSEDTEWMVTLAAGKELRVAFFSGAKPPVLTLDAVQNSTDLCGTFSYVR